MKFYGYTVTRNSTFKSRADMSQFNPKALGYNYICKNCRCPLLDTEKKCPDCYKSSRKKI